LGQQQTHPRNKKKTVAALQHNLGLGVAVVVTAYKRADSKVAFSVPSGIVGRINCLGYNPAVEAKGFITERVTALLSGGSDRWALGDTAQETVVACLLLW
jgi:sterol carrier protein 2